MHTLGKAITKADRISKKHDGQELFVVWDDDYLEYAVCDANELEQHFDGGPILYSTDE